MPKGQYKIGKKEYLKQYKIKNRDKVNAYQRERYKNLPPPTEEKREKLREANRKWAKENLVSYRLRKKEEIAGRPRPEFCEICQSPATQCRWGKLAFDHCHQTGAFRGWICYRCNTILGHAHDDPEILRKLIDYLIRHNQPQ